MIENDGRGQAKEGMRAKPLQNRTPDRKNRSSKHQLVCIWTKENEYGRATDQGSVNDASRRLGQFSNPNASGVVIEDNARAE